MCAAAAAAAFIYGRCLFGGAAACSSADEPSRLKSSCGWGWGRGRRYLSQSLPNPDLNPQNKFLPAVEIQIQKQKVPWLMLSSPTKPESRYFYDLLTRGAGGGHLLAQDGDGDDGMPLIAFNRGIDLPQIAGHQCIGSSQGFLITVDRNAEIHATNPITGARLPLPSTVTLPNMIGVLRDPTAGYIDYYVSSVDTTDSPEIIPLVFEENTGRTSPLLSLEDGNVEIFCMDFMRQSYYRKVILSPSLDTAVAIHLATQINFVAQKGQNFGMGRLAFARLGGDGTSLSWTDLPSFNYFFDDIIFHKGQLYAVHEEGTLSVYDLENPSAQPFCSLEGPPLSEDALGWFLITSVVESADGDDLFLVCRGRPDLPDDGSRHSPRTMGFKVFKLDKSDYKWNQVDSVGDLALFVGYNHTTSLSARDFHGLKPNCIYFTDYPTDWFDRPQLAGDTGVYNLKDGSIQYFRLTEGLQELNWPPPVWFMPAMC